MDILVPRSPRSCAGLRKQGPYETTTAVNGEEHVKKAISLMSKTTTLQMHHAFLYISLLSLHNNYLKRPNFKFT